MRKALVRTAILSGCILRWGGCRQLEVVFQRLAIFRPGIIGGNVHASGYAARLERLIPGPFGTIEEDDIARTFVAEFISTSATDGVVHLENGAMRRLSRQIIRQDKRPL